MRVFIITAIAALATIVSAAPDYKGACPVVGAMECQGQGFVTCDNSGWTYRKCGPGTTCYKLPETGGVYCGYPAHELI